MRRGTPSIRAGREHACLSTTRLNTRPLKPSPTVATLDVAYVDSLTRPIAVRNAHAAAGLMDVNRGLTIALVSFLSKPYIPGQMVW